LKGSLAVPKNTSQLHLSAVNGRRRYASVTEAAAYLGVTDRAIRLMIADGRLSGYRGLGPRVLRIDLNEIDAAMETGGRK
jgi:excisionase family DNA binding protein